MTKEKAARRSRGCRQRRLGIKKISTFRRRRSVRPLARSGRPRFRQSGWGCRWRFQRPRLRLAGAGAAPTVLGAATSDVGSGWGCGRPAGRHSWPASNRRLGVPEWPAGVPTGSCSGAPRPKRHRWGLSRWTRPRGRRWSQGRRSARRAMVGALFALCSIDRSSFRPAAWSIFLVQPLKMRVISAPT